MCKPLLFPTREAFHDWLAENHETSPGVWLLFGKKGGPKTLTAHEALEEALCFGWIDGQMQRIDETAYRKYFAHRTKMSVWSDKNKALVQSLTERGLMQPHGLSVVARAKESGAWDAGRRVVIDEAQVQALTDLLAPYPEAHANFLSMSPSVRRSYTGLYLDAKSEATRKTRLEKIVDRLNRNLKPM